MSETLGSLIAEAASALSAAGFNEPRRAACRLAVAVFSISRTDLFSHPDWPADTGQTSRFRELLHRMINHEPLSRILGRREFWGLEFILSTETLDPRPETETVVEAVLKRKSDRHAPLRFLDFGTGTGCLLIALLGEYQHATGLGIDLAEGAVRTAIRNAANTGIGDRAQFIVGNWGEAVSERFDAIVANPPYIASADLPLLPREVALYDPWLALDGGGDGLVSYRTIAAALQRLLAPGGIFVCEVGVDRADAVAAIMKANGLICDGIEKDLAGVGRCVAARPGG